MNLVQINVNAGKTSENIWKWPWIFISKLLEAGPWAWWLWRCMAAGWLWVGKTRCFGSTTPLRCEFFGPPCHLLTLDIDIE